MVKILSKAEILRSLPGEDPVYRRKRSGTQPDRTVPRKPLTDTTKTTAEKALDDKQPA